MAQSQNEIDRLRRVYAEYSRDRGVAAKWSSDNAGNRAILEEFKRAIGKALEAHGFWPLEHLRILDVGCGRGGLLALFRSWGAQASNLVGIDLLPDVVAQARTEQPDVRFLCGNAEEMAFEDESFDLVAVFTVLSSILDQSLAEAVSARITGVLRPGGAVLWYDFRYRNPRNPNVRGLHRSEIAALFPGFDEHLELVTLLPQLARRLGRLTPVAYPMLAPVRPLRTHYLGLLIKP